MGYARLRHVVAAGLNHDMVVFGQKAVRGGDNRAPAIFARSLARRTGVREAAFLLWECISIAAVVLKTKPTQPQLMAAAVSRE